MGRISLATRTKRPVIDGYLYAQERIKYNPDSSILDYITEHPLCTFNEIKREFGNGDPYSQNTFLRNPLRRLKMGHLIRFRYDGTRNHFESTEFAKKLLAKKEEEEKDSSTRIVFDDDGSKETEPA